MRAKIEFLHNAMKYEGGTPDPPLKPKNVRAWCDEARAKEAGVPYVEAGDSILMKSEMANHGMDLLLDKEEKMELAEDDDDDGGKSSFEQGLENTSEVSAQPP